MDIIKVKTLDNTDTLHGSRILSFITPDVGEVDRIEDIEYIEDSADFEDIEDISSGYEDIEISEINKHLPDP